MRCTLCGAEFEPDASCAAACPMAGLSGGCGHVRCPHCGAEIPDPSRSTLARLVQRWLDRRKPRPQENPDG